MKNGVLVSAFVLVVFSAIIILTDNVEATGNCALPVADRCHGMSMVGTTTGGIASGRCFFFTTLNSAPACSTGGIGTTSNQPYEVDPGGCQTWYYWNVANGASPPATPNKVSLRAYFDTLGSVYYTFVVPPTAPPSSGTSYTFCATSDGITGSSPRAGTWYFEILAVKDNGPGGVGNYNILSSGLGSQDTSFDAGGLRGNTTVASVARSAYPSGSMFAYGTAGNEVVTVTATFTQPGADNGVETSFTSILDEGTLAVGQVGSEVDVDATTTLAQNPYVVDSTFPFANNPYVPGWTIAGNSALFGERWTILSATGHGSNLVRVSDSFIYDSTDITIDSRIVLDSDGTGTFATADDVAVIKLGSSTGALTSVFNKGETYYTEYYIFNARSEKLTRSMTGAREDGTPTTCFSGTQTPSGSGLYSGTSTLSTGVVCATTADVSGAPRYFRFTNTDQNHRSNQVFAVSSLYFVDAHTQLSDPLVEDDFPTENSAEYFNYAVRSDGMGGDDSDTVHGFCHVVGVRKDGTDIDTSGSAVSGEYTDPTSTVRSSGTGDTDSSGWTGHLDILATTPLGEWTWTCEVNFSGNAGIDNQSINMTVEGGGNGTVSMADPLKVFSSPVIINPGETTLIAISASFLNGTARTGAASVIFVTVYDPDGNIEVNSQNPTEVAFGTYTYEFSVPASSQDYGGWLVLINTTDGADVIGTSNTFFLEADGNVEPVTAFETATSTSGIEFLTLIALVVVAVIVWSRSTDYLVQFGMGIFCLIAALVWLMLTAQGGSPANSMFKAGLAVISAFIGFYLIIRCTVDKFYSKEM